MRAVAYIRKSTSGTDEGGVERQEGSFARQETAIRDYAKRKGIEIIRWYEEPASGKSIRKRKIFHQLVRDAKAPSRPFQAIIFGEYDRFMRDVKEAMRYEVDLDDAGVELHFTNLRNDGSSEDDVFKSLARNMAAKYSLDLAQRVVQGMVRKAKMGSWLGGIPPFGYRKEKNQNGFVSLVVNAEEAKVVETLFKLSLKGWGHKKIAGGLNDKGICSGKAARARNSFSNKNPDGKWSGETIRHLLRNPVYKGVYRWNKRARVDCFDWRLEGQGTITVGKLRTQLKEFKNNGSFFVDRQKNPDEWIKKDDAIPVIIPAEIFDAVQERFKPYMSRKWQRSNHAKHLMSGFLRCQNCGNGLSGHRYSKMVITTGKKTFYEYYRCMGAVRKGTHGASVKPMIKREVVDRLANEGMLKRAGALTNPKRVREIFKNRVSEFERTKPNRLLQVEQAVKRIDDEIDRILEAYTRFEKSIPESRVKTLNARRETFEQERKTLLAAGDCHFFDIDQEVDSFLSRARGVKEILGAGELVERRRLRDCFLKRAEVNWLAPEGVPEVELEWFKLPLLVHNTAGEFRNIQAPSTSTICFLALSGAARGYAKTGVTPFLSNGSIPRQSKSTQVIQSFKCFELP